MHMCECARMWLPSLLQARLQNAVAAEISSIASALDVEEAALRKLTVAAISNSAVYSRPSRVCRTGYCSIWTGATSLRPIPCVMPAAACL